MGVEANVCESDWVPTRMRTAIALLHANTFLRKQLLFIIAIQQMEANLGDSRSPTADLHQKWADQFNEMADDSDILKSGGGCAATTATLGNLIAHMLQHYCLDEADRVLPGSANYDVPLEIGRALGAVTTTLHTVESRLRRPNTGQTRMTWE